MLPSIGRLKPAVIFGFTLLSQCSHRIFSTSLHGISDACKRYGTSSYLEIPNK